MKDSKRKVLRLWSGMVLALFLLLLSVSHVSAQEKIVLQLKWDHQFQFAGYYAAKQQGYYRDAGLEVVIRSAVTAERKILRPTDEVLAGRADFGIGAADVIVADEATDALRIVSSIFQESGAHFYLRSDKPFTSLDDLVARYRVARDPNSLIDVEWQAMLRLKGIDPAKTRSVPLAPGLGQLLDGRADVIPGYSISVPYDAAKKGLALGLLDPHDYGLNFYGDSIFTTIKSIETDPEKVERFVAASLRGWHYALNHKKEIAEYITSTYARNAPVDDPVAFNLFQANQIEKLLHTVYVALGYTDISRWRDMHRALKSAGLVQTEFDADKLLWTQEQARQQQRVNRYERIQSIVALALGFSLLLSLFVVVLRKKVAEKTSHLRKANGELLAIYQSSPVPMMILDAEVQLVKANQALFDYLDKPEAEVIGQRPGDLFRCEHADIDPRGCGFGPNCSTCLVRQPILSTLDSDSVVHQQGATLTVNGEKGPEVRHLLISVTPFVAENKQVLVSIEDVSVYVRSQVEREMSDARFRAVSDQAADALILFTTEGQILDINRSACELFNAARTELLEQPVSFFLGEAAQQSLPLVEPRGAIEIELHPRGREPITAEASLNQVELAEETVLLADIRDVSERKRIEKALTFVAEKNWAENEGRFLPELVGFLAAELKVSCALVGELIANATQVHTRGLLLDGELVEDVNYTLAGTPCENVVDKTFCSYSGNIQTLFPEDKMLADLGLESYVGLPLWDSQGEPIGLIALLDRRERDEIAAIEQVLQLVAPRAAQVLEQEKQRARIEAEKRNYQTLFDEMVDAFAVHEMILDEEGRPFDYRFLAVNPAFERTLNLKAEEVVGKTVREISPEVEPLWIAEYGEVATTGNSKRFEGYSAAFDAWYEVSCFAPKIGQFAVSFTDISARKKVEEQSRLDQEELERRVEEKSGELFRAHALLKQDEERLAALLELSGMESLSEQELINEVLEKAVQLTRSEIGYLHLVNPDEDSLCLYAWSKETIRHCKAVADQHYPLSAAGIWADCVRQREPVVHNDYQNEAAKQGYPEGHIHVTRHASVPVFDRDAIVAVLGVGNKVEAYSEQDLRQLRLFAKGLWDILVRKRTELELGEALQKAEAANNAKSVFLSTVSHELRTPLTAILGYSQLLNRRDDLSSEVKNKVQVIDRSGHRLHELINDVLEVSRIESGRVECDQAPFDIYRVLQELEEMFSARIKEKLLDFRLLSDKALPRFVVGDRKKLTQILTNLVGNAIKFTDAGSVRINVLYVETPQEQLEISVQDSGCGISETELTDLFRPFAQGQAGQEQGGTGLGLVISRELARLQGGDLSVRSTPGVGSVFTLTLPTRISTMAVSEPTPEDGIVSLCPAVRERKVLVVDDLEDGRNVMAQLLDCRGLQVVEAQGGNEALQRLQQERFDLLITDLRMPEMDGYGLIRRVRLDKHGRGMKIIAVSASAFEKDRRRVIETGADAFVRKPFDPDEFYLAVAEMLDLEVLRGTETAGEAPSGLLDIRDLQILPVDLREEFGLALRQLDASLLTELCEQIERIDQRLAKSIRRMVDRFEYDRLLDLLNSPVNVDGEGA